MDSNVLDYPKWESANFNENRGEIITVGSDAHTPENVGLRSEKAGEPYVQAGFMYYPVWKERLPVTIKIS